MENSTYVSIFAAGISLLAFFVSALTFHFEYLRDYYDMRVFVSEIQTIPGKEYPRKVEASITFVNNGTEPVIVNSSSISIQPNKSSHEYVCKKNWENMSPWNSDHGITEKPIAIPGGTTERSQLEFKIDARLKELTGVYEYAKRDYSGKDGKINVCVYISVLARGVKEQKFKSIGLLSPITFSTNVGSNVTTYHGQRKKWFSLEKVGR